MKENKCKEKENRSSEQIQMTITFDSDVRLCLVLYRDARN